MKPYPPTLREKKRYVSFVMHSEKRLPDAIVARAVVNAVSSFVGEKGLADADFSVIKCSGGKGIVRCTARTKDDVIAALTLLTKAGGKRAWIEVTGVSGTIKKARYAPG